MTTAPIGENPVNLAGRELTAIDGIGKERAAELEGHGINSPQDLAEASDETLESIADTWSGVSANRLKTWRSEAQGMLSSQQAIKPSKSEGKWKSTDVFIVEFQVLEVEGRPEKQQIIAEHIEVRDGTWQDKVTGESQEVKHEELYRWVRKKLGARMPELKELPVEVPPAAAAAPPTAAPPVKVEVTRICAFQPPGAETPTAVGEAGNPFSSFVSSGEPFALEVSFELGGPAAADIVKRRTTYSAQFHVHNLTTRAKTSLGDTKAAPLVAGEPPYTARLPQASLQPGVYRLWALVTLQSTPPSMGYLEVPMLQVV